MRYTTGSVIELSVRRCRWWLTRCFFFVCLQDEGDSYEDDTSDEDSDENSHTWFSLEKGSILTCNSSTMKAAITEAKKS